MGFQGGRWVSAHIDDLRTPSEAALSLEDALTAPISHLFYNMDFVSGAQEQPQDDDVEEEIASAKAPIEKKAHCQCSRLYDCIQAAVARVVDSEKSKEWATRRVKTLLDLVPQQPTFPLGELAPV